MHIFGRKKDEPDKEEIAARLDAFSTKTGELAFRPAEEATDEDHAQDYERLPGQNLLDERTLSFETDDQLIEIPTPSYPLQQTSYTPQSTSYAPHASSHPLPSASAVPPPAPATPARALSWTELTSGESNNSGEFAVPADAAAQGAFFPRRPQTIEDTNLSQAFITDLIIRMLYQSNELMGATLAERTALPFAQVILPILDTLRRDQEIEVKRQSGIGDSAYVYGITERGVRHARESMERIGYAGPAPVPLDDYIESVLAQSVRNVVVTQDTIRAAFGDLVLEEDILDLVGPAVNTGSSMFLFGYPGNGKTSIAERITNLMGDSIYIPYAVEVDGSVITVFDGVNHTLVEEQTAAQRGRVDWDARWVKIARPVVMVGGELTMSSLDLLYNDRGKFYEAPLQMKANGGMFLIDDFGRQMIRPQDLLNRWIVPLEKRVDFLNLMTGKKLAMPFEQLIVFSTNLDPKDLVDEAFLRRIKFKINVVDPTEDQFRAIFRMMCERRGVEYNETALRYMLDTYYHPVNRPLRMCQPRDILDQIVAIAKYKMIPATLNQALIDRACQTYFVAVGG
jgi:predicted ATPase with chaperone activity